MEIPLNLLLKVQRLGSAGEARRAAAADGDAYAAADDDAAQLRPALSGVTLLITEKTQQNQVYHQS